MATVSLKEFDDSFREGLHSSRKVYKVFPEEPLMALGRYYEGKDHPLMATAGPFRLVKEAQ